MSAKRQPFYAVRVVIQAETETYTRDYVRGEQRMGRSAFDSYALGHMLRLVSERDQWVKWDIHEIDFNTVRENRQYHHTTH